MTMKKILKFLVCWCVPGILLLPVGGCFTAASRFMGGRPSATGVIACGALDVVTMPVQIVVLGPMLVHECIDANTGVRGEKKRYQKEVSQIRAELTSDFSIVFSCPEFLSPTNTPQREALSGWLSAYNVNQPKRELIDSLAERLLDNYEAAYALMSILPQRNLSPDVKRKLCVSLVEGSRTQGENRQSSVVYSLLTRKHLSEADLKSLVSGKADSMDEAIEKCLRQAEKERGERLRREEEYAARQKAWMAEQRKRQLEAESERHRQSEEAARVRARRNAELREIADKIFAEPSAFAEALVVRRESVVANRWQSLLRNTATPLPPENVKKLAELLTEPGEPMSECCWALFLRPELTESDLRALYFRVLKKLMEQGKWQEEGWRYAGKLIRNPNFPPDLARASYVEPLLTELRIVYVVHHVHSSDFSGDELQKFERKVDDLKRDCHNGKISLEKSNARRFELTKRYLPAECPDDWVKSIP